MPAYRSSAEAEIRDAVVARIRHHRPNARIIHEINVSTYGPNRIDVLAVDVSEMIAVEIKSEKDKLDRLPDQMKAMAKSAHHAIAAVHEKFLVEQITNPSAGHYERDGQWFMRRLPDDLRHSDAWVYPERRRSVGDYDRLEKWRFPEFYPQIPLPHGALGFLWAAELQSLCNKLKLSVGRRPNMGVMTNALRWNCTGRQLTLGICEMLRCRECIEADPPIFAKEAA